jgi:hypothetical protein
MSIGRLGISLFSCESAKKTVDLHLFLYFGQDESELSEVCRPPFSSNRVFPLETRNGTHHGGPFEKRFEKAVQFLHSFVDDGLPGQVFFDGS